MALPALHSLCGPVLCVASTVALSTHAHATKAAQCVSGNKTQVSVATYNVLSDALCSTNYYTLCSRRDCDSAVRFKRVKAKIEQQMRDGAVVCLQEVSRDWGAKLIPLFEEHGYAYAAAPYGTEFNGYMGQCLAWPRDRYAIEDIDTSRVSTTVTGWPRPPPRDRSKDAASETPGALGLINGVLGMFGARLAPAATAANTNKDKDRPPLDVWAEARRRHNCAVSVRLTDRKTSRHFVVSTYHMPCLFGTDEKCQVMVAHAALLAQHAQRFASGDPLIVAGDFNFKPYDPAYKLVTEGSIPEDHPQHPPPAPFNAAWAPRFTPMRSAYAVMRNGEEPQFTNLARRHVDEDEFAETLDYVWLSDQWEVKRIAELPRRDQVDKRTLSFPSATEPSDHLLLRADLTLAK